MSRNDVHLPGDYWPLRAFYEKSKLAEFENNDTWFSSSYTRDLCYHSKIWATNHFRIKCILLKESLQIMFSQWLYSGLYQGSVTPTEKVCDCPLFFSTHKAFRVSVFLRNHVPLRYCADDWDYMWTVQGNHDDRKESYAMCNAILPKDFSLLLLQLFVFEKYPWFNLLILLPGEILIPSYFVLVLLYIAGKNKKNVRYYIFIKGKLPNTCVKYIECFVSIVLISVIEKAKHVFKVSCR